MCDGAIPTLLYAHTVRECKDLVEPNIYEYCSCHCILDVIFFIVHGSPQKSYHQTIRTTLQPRLVADVAAGHTTRVSRVCGIPLWLTIPGFW